MKRYATYGVLALLGVALATYGLDDLAARFRKDQFASVKVDQVYAIRNRWDVVEYSIGTPRNERCVNSLMPHFGAQPCWYVRSHTLNINRGG